MLYTNISQMFESKYGITSIVSERRSGMTTMLNEFIKKNVFDKKILVISCNKECAKKTCIDVVGNKNIEYDSDKQLIHKLINKNYDIIIYDTPDIFGKNIKENINLLHGLKNTKIIIGITWEDLFNEKINKAIRNITDLCDESFYFYITPYEKKPIIHEIKKLTLSI